MFSPLEQYDIILFNGFFFFNIILPIIIISIFFFFITLFFKGNKFLLPNFWQSSFELLIIFIIKIIKQQIGFRGYIYLPLIFTLFLVLLFCNLLSLTPFSVALTSHISIVAFLTFTLNIAIFIKGFAYNNLNFLGIFVPTSPLLLLFLLVPIEIFSYSIRSLSMAIRLVANIIAGHTLVFIITTFLLKIFNLKIFFFFNLLIILFAIFTLELGVAFLQAYVFIVLLCIYLNDSINLVAH